MYVTAVGGCLRMLSDRYVVPRRGLEPPRLAALVPETSASTNSATWAHPDLGTEPFSACQMKRIAGLRRCFSRSVQPASDPLLSGFETPCRSRFGEGMPARSPKDTLIASHG